MVLRLIGAKVLLTDVTLLSGVDCIKDIEFTNKLLLKHDSSSCSKVGLRIHDKLGFTNQTMLKEISVFSLYQKTPT